MADILYVYKTSIYANLTNKCPCRCTFCIRNNTDSVEMCIRDSMNHACCSCNLTGNMSVFILREDFVKNCVGNLVSVVAVWEKGSGCPRRHGRWRKHDLLGSWQEPGGGDCVRVCAGGEEQVADGQGLYTAGCWGNMAVNFKESIAGTGTGRGRFLSPLYMIKLLNTDGMLITGLNTS